MRGGERGPCNRENAFTIRFASISKVGGFLFIQKSEQDQKEVEVGKWDVKVGGSDRSEAMLP